MFDARRSEVYNAVYKDGSKICPDRAIHTDALFNELSGKEVVFAGDGAIIHSEKIKSMGEIGWSIAPQHLILPKASSVAYSALKRAQKGDFDDVYTLNPVYLRKSQAEREREERENKGE